MFFPNALAYTSKSLNSMNITGMTFNVKLGLIRRHLLVQLDSLKNTTPGRLGIFYCLRRKKIFHGTQGLNVTLISPKMAQPYWEILTMSARSQGLCHTFPSKFGELYKFAADLDRLKHRTSTVMLHLGTCLVEFRKQTGMTCAIRWFVKQITLLKLTWRKFGGVAVEERSPTFLTYGVRDLSAW